MSPRGHEAYRSLWRFALRLSAVSVVIEWKNPLL